MAKSSIHIQTDNTNHGILLHNARENHSHSVVFFDEKNELLNTSKEAFRIYRKELQKRAKAYQISTGQKLQKRVSTHLSIVVNLNSNHTLEDLEPLIKKIEDDLDTKTFQVAIHRDEGTLVCRKTGDSFFSGVDFFVNPENKKFYKDAKYSEPLKIDDFEIKKNYHAHIEILGIDTQGKAIKRNRLNKFFLRELQNYTAKILKMERGQNNSKRKEVKKFKSSGVDKREARKKEKAKVKELENEAKKEIKILRAELKEAGATREEYAKLEQLNRDLKEQISDKDLTIAGLHMQISIIRADFEEILKSKDEEIAELRNYAEEEIDLRRDAEYDLAMLQIEFDKQIKSNKSKDEEIDNMRSQISKLRNEEQSKEIAESKLILAKMGFDAQITELKKEVSMLQSLDTVKENLDEIDGLKYLYHDKDIVKKFILELEKKSSENEALKKENQTLSQKIDLLLAKLEASEQMIENLKNQPHFKSPKIEQNRDDDRFDPPKPTLRR